MKKFLLLTTSLFFLVGCGSGSKKVYKEYQDYGLNPNHIIEKVNYDKLMNLLDGVDEQIYYFGWAECPNCQAAIKYIDNVAKNIGFKKIYYYDFQNIRNEDQDSYKNFIEKIAYTNDNKTGNGVSRMPAPTVVVRKNGQTLNWVTREYFVDEKTKELSSQDQRELIVALTELYNLLNK